MKWPIFSEKELIICNLKSKIGVATLWSPRNDFVKKRLSTLKDKIAVIGNLYTIFGIGVLIRNCLANPNLRYLIVTGRGLGKAKKVLGDLKNYDSTKLFLKSEHIDQFLKQVKIVFSESDEVVEVLQKKEFIEPRFESEEFKSLIVPLPKPETDIFPAASSGHLIHAKTVKEGYLKLLLEIRNFGHITGEDFEGHRRQELWQLNMIIRDQDPIGFNSIPHPEYSIKEIKAYCEDFWKGKEPEDLAYRYGHIIRFGFGNQIEAVVKAIKKKPETFRTVISLWNPDVEVGSIVAEDPPCLTLIHPRIINGFLHQWAYIRTNDMFGGWPLNAIALRYFQRKLLEELKEELDEPGLQLGDCGITSGSAHLYERDWLIIDNFLKNEVKQQKINFDPKGNFDIKVVENKITVNHFGLTGELLQNFEGKSARKLSKTIEPFISEISNALYLGRELAKAELKLKK